MALKGQTLWACLQCHFLSCHMCVTFPCNRRNFIPTHRFLLLYYPGAERQTALSLHTTALIILMMGRDLSLAYVNWRNVKGSETKSILRKTNLSDAVKGTKPKEQQRTQERCLKHWIKHTRNPTVDQKVEGKQWICWMQTDNIGYQSLFLTTKESGSWWILSLVIKEKMVQRKKLESPAGIEPKTFHELGHMS